LLSDRRSVALLEAAGEGWLELSELQGRLHYGGKAFEDRLSRLAEMGLLAERPAGGANRRREYALTRAGRELLEVHGELLAVAGALDALGGERGALLRKSIVDRWDGVSLLQLLSGRQSVEQLRHVLPFLVPRRGASYRRLGSASVSMRLERLELLGLVRRLPEPWHDEVRYEPGERAWRLARLSVALARWHWRWTPEQAPRLAGHLRGLAELIGERVRVARDLRPSYVMLHVIVPEGMEGWPDTLMAIGRGRISPHGIPSWSDPAAYCQAHPWTWCEALLSGDFDGVQIDGDAELARGLLDGLVAVLQA